MRHPNMMPVALSISLALVATTLPGTPALASRAMPIVTGEVNAVSANHIVVDGKSYSVQLQGRALHQLQQVQSGQKVDLVLDGPPQAATTHVVDIHVRQAQR